VKQFVAETFRKRSTAAQLGTLLNAALFRYGRQVEFICDQRDVSARRNATGDAKRVRSAVNPELCWSLGSVVAE